MKKSLLIGCLLISVLLIIAFLFLSLKNVSQDVNNSTNSSNTGKLKAIACPESYRGAEICTLEYNPVCGWYNASKVQCVKYPCAIDAGNICGACSNPDVEYYTEGVCPTDGKLV